MVVLRRPIDVVFSSCCLPLRGGSAGLPVSLHRTIALVCILLLLLVSSLDILFEKSPKLIGLIVLISMLRLVMLQLLLCVHKTQGFV